MIHRRLLAVVLVLVPTSTAVLSSSSCAWNASLWPAPPASSIPAAPLHFIEDGRLSSTMQRLANDIIELDHVMRVEPRRQQDVLAVLDDVQGAVAKISSPGQSTNHPRLDEELERFALDVANVRAEVASDPPGYAGVQAVPTMCLRCHDAH